MTAGDIAPIIIAAFTVLTAFIGGAFWLSKVEGAAKKALEDVRRVETDLLRDIADLEDKVLPALIKRMEALEAHKADVAVLSAQMSMVIERLGELSNSVQLLISTQARHGHRQDADGQGAGGE